MHNKETIPEIKMKNTTLWIIALISLVLLPSAYADMSGWRTTSTGWSVNEELVLVGTTTSGTAIDIYSDPFDIRLGKEYTLRANITVAAGCVVRVDLNDGRCLSRTNWVQTGCFNDVPFRLTTSGSKTVLLPASDPDASQGYFKNVSVRIHVDAGCTEAKFDDISFKEVSPIDAQQQLQPPINLTTACCPAEYCWDGSQCVTSDPWYISNNSNLWSIIDINSYYRTHVNTTMHWLSRGYRCILNDSNYANWEEAQVKYDWNFEESGYCIRDSDCFVSNTFGTTPENRQAFIDSLNNSRSSCIKNGQFINNNFVMNQGNHYCMNGEWTTKTFLIANVLENISADKPYIIFCDDTGAIFNNLIGVDSGVIPGGCVLISKEGDEERIITGFYAEDPTTDVDGSDDIMWRLYQKHIADLTGNVLDIELIVPSFVRESYRVCDGYDAEATFVKCGHYGATNGALYLYVNLDSFYYLVSDSELNIEGGFFSNIWNAIVGFFQNLFGYTPSEPLGLAAQTKNYERLYVLNNNTLKVYGVEERKYDEQVQELMTLMYLNMTGQNIPQNNSFNIEYVNKTIGGAYYEYTNTSGSQVLLIKYSDPEAELWPYLTAMLRDR